MPGSAASSLSVAVLRSTRAAFVEWEAVDFDLWAGAGACGAALAVDTTNAPSASAARVRKALFTSCPPSSENRPRPRGSAPSLAKIKLRAAAVARRDRVSDQKQAVCRNTPAGCLAQARHTAH